MEQRPLQHATATPRYNAAIVCAPASRSSLPSSETDPPEPIRTDPAARSTSISPKLIKTDYLAEGLLVDSPKLAKADHPATKSEDAMRRGVRISSSEVIDLSHRQRAAEWMDSPDIEPAQLARGLRFIRGVNAMLGYTRATLRHLARFSQTWRPGEMIRIVDFATGSADIPRAIVRWADRHGFDVRVVGVDLHAFTASQARQLTRDERRISIVRGDVLAPPFDDGSFDYAITNMFLHHLDDDQVVRVLRHMDRVARRGVIAADLLRNRRAHAWIKVLTAFANPMLKHDARVSVAQAFTREEICRLRGRAGIDFARFYRHFGHRFVLAGQKHGAG
jgi:ubiquinone/menaquinone biosynthesis C-methylase UbiE